MKTNRLLILIALLLLAASGLMAQTVVKATLDGGQEVPKQATSMNGEAIYLISADKLSIDYVLNVRNAGTAITAAQVHLGPPDISGSITFVLFDEKVDGTFKGKKSGTLTALDFIATADFGLFTFADAVQAMGRGNTYTNVRTTRVPLGEARGQNKPLEIK